MGTSVLYPSCTVLSLLLVLWSASAELTFLGQEPNRAFVPQTIQERGTVYQFFVIDTSSNEMPTGVTFSSSLTNLFPFLLDPLTGELVMNGLIAEEEYFIVVQATTSSDSITIVTNITIVVVVPISDTRPRFEHNLYEIDISENLPQSSPFSAIRAFSLTLNPSSQEYSIVAGNTDGDFSINSGNGLLRVNEILDRERTSSYQLTIRYVDDLAFVDTSVEVSIQDVNDEAPQFSRSLYNVTVAETLPPGSTILTVDATDDDVGTNAMVTYSFDATASITFSLNQTDGVLRTISQLDYERQPRYQFSITVQDGGTPQLTSVTTVLVNLINIDDECPRFENAVFIEELPYDIAGTPPGVGTEILTVMATDPDRFSEVTYSVISGSTPVLALNSATGAISLASNDDDPRGQYTLNVSASDQNCINKSFVRVEIGIGNVNDHSPRFESDCTAIIEENPVIGTQVATLLATDDDIGFNGLVTYTLLSGTELFEIDASGVVRTIAPPETYDRELQSTLLAGVTATDGGGRQDYCLLTVTLSDQNDNVPRIPLSSYNTSLARDSGSGAFVLQITADDPDVGDSGRIEYSIESEIDSLPFEINSLNGVITTSDTFSSTNSFTFSVVATDMGPTVQLTSDTMVTITLTDGDAVPRFSAVNYTGIICENPSISSVVLTVNVTNTSPDDHFVDFVILAGSDYRSNSDRTFDIRLDFVNNNLARLVVGSRTVVDFEQLSPHLSFQFFVEASTGSGRSIVPVEIFVIDVDDNSPEFLTPIMSIAIAENEPVGTTVAQLQAVDPDSGTNGEVQYRFLTNQPSAYFSVAADGFITSLQVFDFETALDTRGDLLIEAYNPNPVPTDSMCNGPNERISTPIRIRWSILDQNDNPPAFEASVFTATIDENTPIQTRVLELNATDMDVSDLAQLTFSINSGNDGTFGIESHYIILIRRLDFESAASYELVVHVTDGIHSIQDCPQSGCIAMVIITVLDVDDEPPVFSSLTYRASVVENAPIGTSILQISARDIDSPSIEYRLTGLAQGRFHVNQSGVITVIGEIDREAFPGGELVFLAFAEGGSLATADVFIDIQDVNDYAPRFSGVFAGGIEENTVPGEEGIVVTQVRAVDLDAGENGTVLYSLAGSDEHGFRIHSETGVITAHATYDRETTPTFVLIVVATDNGTSIQLSSRTEVVIEIGDMNDNSVHFQFPYMFARVFENAPIGHSVLFLPVVDADSETNSQLEYSLLAMTPLETKFALNSTTGEITIVGSLDYEIPLHRLYTLTVSVVDLSTPPSSEGTLQIELLDRNDNAPTISISRENSLLQETFPTGVQVAMVTGSDMDSGKNAELIFEITNGNSNNDFVLLMEGERAIIKSANQLDYETTFLYSLTVTISDMGSPPLSTTAICEFTIIDVNDEAPLFTESEYQVSIIESSAPSASLLQIEASDKDTGNGGVIARYELVSGNDGGWFALNESSGVLSSIVTFDREERAEYVITVAAYDSGPVPIRGTARVVVTIKDVNDNPSFDGGHLNVLINALNGQVAPGNIAPLNFNDPDTNDTFSQCVVIRQDHANVFDITDSCTIQLLVSDLAQRDYNYVEVRGRDGTNTDVDVTATIRVVHFIYTGPMSPVADNLVTVTLNASSEQYIQERLNITFPVQLARALQVADRDIEIVTVQRGVFAPDTSVDISFVARQSTGNFISPAAILHQLYVQRDSLVIDGHQMLSLPLDVCVSEPCQNQAGCRTVQNVLPTERVVSTREFVYFAPRIDFTYECECVPGTTGQYCETNFNDCYSNPCQQGAACTDLVNGFSCDCLNGYTGVDCSVAPDTCSTNLCSNEATCTIVNDDINCDCNPGYYGPRCQYQYFIPSSLCQEENPCQNEAECSAGRDALSCSCLPGFSGQFCEVETLVQGGCVGNPCYNGSVCEETLQGLNCICSIGFTGPNCRWPLNSCELQPCLNGGTCATGLYGTHVCSCLSGYTGDDCGVSISPCLSNPCLNNGRCAAANNDAYSCECLSGYYGTDCERTFQPVDFCSMVDCSNNGNCTSGRDSFTCSCDGGFTGEDCSISTESDDACGGNPCRHGSTCTRLSTGEGFNCVCSPGFNGTLCEVNVNECADTPCTDGSTCTDGINGYSCTCQSGLAGYNCEIQCPQGLTGPLCQTPLLTCLDTPCFNNGTCSQEAATTVSCSCPPTHSGSRCETELVCTLDTCLNGGSCTELSGGGVECACGEEFLGDNCELLTVSFAGSSSQSSYRAFDSLNIRGQGRLEFDFATVDSNGLLLYNTQLQNGRSNDYVAVEIVGGTLQVSVSHGNGDSSVSFMSSPRGVADGNWHRVVIETNQKEFRALLDDCLLLPASLLPFATCSLTSVTPGGQGFLDLGLPLWLGGAPIAASSAHFMSHGITGCIRRVRTNGRLLDLEGYVFEANSMRGCSHLESSVCVGESPSVCGGGRCLSVFDAFSCDCPSRQVGVECESAAQSVGYGGGSYAKYSILEYLPLSVAKRQASTDSIRSTISDAVSLWLRTEMVDGAALLLYMASETTGDEFYIQLEDGVLVLKINLGLVQESLLLTNRIIADSAWHFVEVKRSALELTATVDDVTIYHTLKGTHLSLDVRPIIYTGGRPDSGGSNIMSPYLGCLEDIRIDGNPLPTSGANSFATVVFVGEEVSYNCALGPCLPNPCGRGNCSEVTLRGESSFECACERGGVVIGNSCLGEPTPPMFTLIVVFATVAGGLLICVTIISMGMVCYQYRRRLTRLKVQVGDHADISLAILNRQALGVSNEAGGGERDTHIGIDEISNTLFANKHAIDDDEKEYSETLSSTDTSISKPSFSNLQLAASPTIGEFIREKIERVPKDYRDFDSVHEYEEEGNGSITGSLSTICSSIAESEYTIEKLKAAGSELEPFLELLADVLESEEEEDMDGGSQQAHTGNTQLTQATPYSQELW